MQAEWSAIEKGALKHLRANRQDYRPTAKLNEAARSSDCLKLEKVLCIPMGDAFSIGGADGNVVQKSARLRH